ncbi:hypothetical protein HDU99_002682, partial [Rhizoclosmatium hyalinum]
CSGSEKEDASSQMIDALQQHCGRIYASEFINWRLWAINELNPKERHLQERRFEEGPPDHI